ncbi:MAG: hypothetical protein LWX07_08590 [Bacteroidetes bacterium]|nr:hypothetical protein [Bacteroidota bacterium]
MRKIRFYIILLVFLSVVTSLTAQVEEGKTDTTSVFYRKPVSGKPSGIFATPFLGMDFPMKTFADNSNNAVTYGVRLEFASLHIYPLVLFGEYQFSKHPGNDIFKSQYYLNTLETRISAFGGGFYFLANKYLKSNFTSPFIVGEVKFYNVTRLVTPDVEIEGLKKSESKVVLSGGLGFTLYIFDIITSYNFGGDYSSLSVKTQFHFPLLKF